MEIICEIINLSVIDQMIRLRLYLSSILLLTIILNTQGCRTPEEIHRDSIRETENLFYLTNSEIDPPANDRNLRVNHYPASNERRIDFFYDHIKGIKGIYIGVGTDQNLTFLAWARSDFAYLMDFDIVAVYVNKIHLFFISQSPTILEFGNYWKRNNQKASFKILKKKFEKQNDWKLYQQAWKIAFRGESDVPERFGELRYMARHFKLKTFTNNPEDYSFIRKMVLNHKIQAISGDLKGFKTMQNIARRSLKMNLPVRVLYLSNAEDYFRYPENMRKNYLALPVDDKSVVIRTISVGARYLGFPKGEKFPESGPLHYNVQSLKTFQSWMRYYPKGRLRAMHMLRGKGKKRISHGFSLQVKTPAQLGLVKVE